VTILRPDPTFYPSPRMAMLAPPEEHAYVVLLNPDGNGRPDALAVMDVNSTSSTYQQVVGRVELGAGDEVHHFGWNACSAALCPYAPHPHVERRYLLVPGLKSSRIHVIDTKPDPARPTIVKVIEADELHERTGYSRPHTFHCGPDAIYVSALGAPDGNGPGGIFVMDHDTFEPLGRWEVERGPQRLAYDFWWHLGYDTMVTSEWGTPNMIEGGLNPEILMQSGYGHQMHVWDLRRRKHLQALDLGEEYQILLELRPAHDPSKAYGFAGAVVCLKDLSASIWLWHREDSGAWAIRKVIDIPAEPADPDLLPPILKGFGEVPPLATDLNLSLDDKFLYVSCWGTGELRQYDVSDPFNPRHTGSVHLGGIVRKTAHPSSGSPLNGGPQMVEVSRDGRRVYFSNSLYSSWDEQFYPDGIKGWVAKLDANPDGGGLAVDPDFFIEFGEERPHQIRLEGGDSSSDSFCYPS
jgi:selenium-binding protein 1